jgi:hypothetical protein
LSPALSPPIRAALGICWTVLWWYVALSGLWLLARVLV